MTRHAPIETRFFRRVKFTDTCWLWTGNKNAAGYGLFTPVGKRKILAHRFAYERVVGPIPEDLQLDHLCRNRRCVRPDHLEPVTCSENLHRGDTIPARNRAKTHCKRGHAFDAANTYLNGGRRQCRACHADLERERRRAA